MTENMTHPPAIPPQIPLRPAPDLRPLGEDPSEKAPIPNALAAIESVLRQPRRVMYQLRQPGSGRLVRAMIVVAVVCAAAYGVVVGTFSMGTQLWAAPVKLAGGMLLAALICLPSLYIFSCLSGSQARLGEVAGLVAGLLMIMTIVMVGFAPVAWLFSQSTESVNWMGALHLIFWLVGTIFGLRFLSAGFAHSNARTTAGLSTWSIIFLLVGLQMSAALRPIVGRADTFLPTEKKFFVTHWLDEIKTAGARRGSMANY